MVKPRRATEASVKVQHDDAGNDNVTFIWVRSLYATNPFDAIFVPGSRACTRREIGLRGWNGLETHLVDVDFQRCEAVGERLPARRDRTLFAIDHNRRDLPIE